MQHVNNDMDDLFRKAGEQYPLLPGKPDWDKVAAALSAEDASTPGQRTGNKRLLWLLLLLPLSLVCNHYWQAGKDKDTTTTAVERTLPVSLQQGDVQVAAQVPGTAKQDPHTVQQTRVKAFEATSREQTFRGKKKGITQSHPTNVGSGNLSLPGIHPMTQVPDASPGAANHLLITSSIPAPSEGDAERAIGLLMAEAPIFTSPQLQPSAVHTAIRQALVEDSTGQHLRVPNRQSWEPNWYAGIIGSADLTSVQLQRTSRVGWQTGLLAGYQFSRRWSVETGFYISRKYYYTEGEYFDKGHTYIPPNTTITEVSGYCTMLELPLNIRYNLVQNRQHSWFATAGLSSYFMKREGYDFLYYYQTSGTSRIHSKTYNNASRNLFSVVQLTGGYTRSLKRTLSLRVEPYLKLPLTGLGYGKLNFSSTGLNLGVVKRF